MSGLSSHLGAGPGHALILSFTLYSLTFSFSVYLVGWRFSLKTKRVEDGRSADGWNVMQILCCKYAVHMLYVVCIVCSVSTTLKTEWILNFGQNCTTFEQSPTIILMAMQWQDGEGEVDRDREPILIAWNSD